MQKELEDIGLSEKEARVYLASLALGKATADQLAKQAGIKRPTAYVQIESLSKMGLMSTFEEGKKTYFLPESPDGLKRVLTRARDELQSKERGLSGLLPGLLQRYESAGERPVVRFFEGKDGIKAMREEVLKTKEREILVIYSHDTLAQFFSEEERADYSSRRVEAELKARMIYNCTTGPFPSGKSRRLSEQRYIEKERLDIQNDIVIFGNNVAISTFVGNLSGVLISGKEFANSSRSLFEFVWKTLER